MAAFVMGAFITTLFFVGYGRHYIRWQSTAVPSAAEDHNQHSHRSVEQQQTHRDDDTEEEDDEHWRSTAAAVDEWRTSQLAVARSASDDDDSQGLEMT